jgi:hypothetical protein
MKPDRDADGRRAKPRPVILAIARGALIDKRAPRSRVIGRPARVGHVALEVLQFLLGARPHRTALRRSSIHLCAAADKGAVSAPPLWLSLRDWRLAVRSG